MIVVQLIARRSLDPKVPGSSASVAGKEGTNYSSDCFQYWSESEWMCCSLLGNVLLLTI